MNSYRKISHVSRMLFNKGRLSQVCFACLLFQSISLKAETISFNNSGDFTGAFTRRAGTGENGFQEAAAVGVSGSRAIVRSASGTETISYTKNNPFGGLQTSSAILLRFKYSTNATGSGGEPLFFGVTTNSAFNGSQTGNQADDFFGVQLSQRLTGSNESKLTLFNGVNGTRTQSVDSGFENLTPGWYEIQIDFTKVGGFFELSTFLHRMSADGASRVETNVISAAMSSLANADLVGATDLYLYMGGTNTLSRGVTAIDELNTTGFGNLPSITAPSGLVATALSQTQVGLAWSDNSNNETSFSVERRQGSGSWSVVASLAPNTVSYSNSGLLGETNYSYRIFAVNSEAVSSASNVASATTLGEPVPAVPLNLIASASSTTQINLSWIDASDNEFWFRLERKVGDGNFSQLLDLVPNISNYSDVGLTPNTTYAYRISAANAVGYSNPSNEAQASTPNLPVPAAPSGFQNTAIGQSSVSLSWTDNANDEIGYRVERKTGNEDFVEIAELAAGSTAFIDTDVSELNTYYYVVYAYNNNGSSAFSNVLEVITPFVVPTNLTASAVSSDHVELTWNDNSKVETGYRIQRKTSTGGYITIVNVGNSVSSFSDLTVNPETSYTYRVQGISFGYLSEFTNEATIGTPAQVPPTPPANLAIVSQGLNYVNLKWSDRSDDETGFVVERKVGDGSFAAYATLDREVTTYTDGQVSELGKYGYRVVSANEAGNSAPSNEVSTQIQFNHPANLIAQAISSNRIDLAWDDKSSSETGYLVERKTNQQSFEVVATLPSNSKSYSDSEVEALSTYTYRVIATNGSMKSNATNEASASTPNVPVPGSVTGLTASLVDGVSVALSWTDNSIQENGFRIEKRIGTGSWVELFTVPGNTTSFQDFFINELVTLSYRVVSFNDGGDSSASNVASLAIPFNPPSNLKAIASTQARIDLIWDDNSQVESGYRLERKSGEGAFEALTTVEPGLSAYADETVLVNVEYTYRVVGIHAGGESAPSNEVSSKTSGEAIVPNAPTGLAAQALGHSEVQLTWTDTSDNESGFRIERKLGAEGSFTFIGTAGANATSYTDSGLNAETDYYYRIASWVDGAQSSEASQEVMVSTSALPSPEAPSGLLASQQQSSKSVVLSWMDNSSIESGYKIQKKTGDGAFSDLVTLDRNLTVFTDTAVAELTDYSYRVYANNETGNSAFSNEASAAIPLAPPAFVVGNSVSPTSVELDWVDNSSKETGFRILRRSDTADWATLGETGPNITGFVDNTAQPDTTYSYQMLALSFGIESSLSNTVNVTTSNIPAPESPSDLVVQGLSETSISISWVDNSDNEAGFRVFRKEQSNGVWVEIASVQPDVTLFVDNQALPGVNYAYRVLAYNAGGSVDPVQTDFRIPIVGRLINISTRGLVETGDNVMIGSFIVRGDGPKTVLIRGMGPSLASSMNTNILGDPEVTLVSGVDLNNPIAYNDDWRDTNEAGVIAAGLPPEFETESAIVIRLNPGAYSAILSGVNNTSGFGLIEVYEMDYAKNIRIINISTRSLVQEGDKRMIGGFIIRGDTPARVFIRASGPSLPASIGNRLADPVLELYSGQERLVFNDNWQDSEQIGDIIATDIPPKDLKEPAIVATLMPGSYSAVVGGMDGSSGYSLLEIYDYPE